MSDLEKITIDLDPKRLPNGSDRFHTINVQQALEASIREILEPDEALLGQLESEFHKGGRVYIFHKPQNLGRMRRRVEDFLRSIGYTIEMPKQSLLPPGIQQIDNPEQGEITVTISDDTMRNMPREDSYEAVMMTLTNFVREKSPDAKVTWNEGGTVTITGIRPEAFSQIKGIVKGFCQGILDAILFGTRTPAPSTSLLPLSSN